MLKCLLNSLLLVSISIAAPDPQGFGQLANEGIHPSRMTIGEVLDENSLDQHDGEVKTAKRQTNNKFMDFQDEISDAPNDLETINNNQDANLEVKSTLNRIQMPDKKSSPAFSIHAQKVYIVYPTLLQDPNIFGRFSMPQTVNLDPSQQQRKPGPNLPPPGFPGMLPQGKRVMRRQAPNPSEKPEEKKRNVETHLQGSIVVLNQDVNEFNQKDSY